MDNFKFNYQINGGNILQCHPIMDLKILSLGVNHQLYDYDNPNMTFIHAQKKKKKKTLVQQMSCI